MAAHAHSRTAMGGARRKPVADYFDKLITALDAEAPLDEHTASLRYDELACMRRSLAVAAAPAAPSRHIFLRTTAASAAAARALLRSPTSSAAAQQMDRRQAAPAIELN